jgi:hypothetical protein
VRERSLMASATGGLLASPFTRTGTAKPTDSDGTLTGVSGQGGDSDERRNCELVGDACGERRRAKDEIGVAMPKSASVAESRSRREDLRCSAGGLWPWIRGEPEEA